MRIGIIGSTGIKMDLLTDKYEFETIDVDTKQFRFYRGYINDKELILTARNQYNGSIAPHKVDYKLIMQGMKALNVDVVLGTAVTGSLTTDITPGTYLVLDQFLDFTKRTPATFFESNEFAFVDFSQPYCPTARKNLIQACINAKVTFLPYGCYVGVDGPRYETSAEVKMYRILGGDVVGMTNVTETIFARESGLCYAVLCIVVNYGAGLGEKKEVIRKDCYEKTLDILDNTVEILRQFIKIYDGNKECDCQTKNSDMLKSQFP